MDTELKKSQDLREGLAGFYGSEQLFSHMDKPFSLHYTEGVRCFAENCGGGAYWFLDIVSTELANLMRTEEFLVVTLDVQYRLGYAEGAQAEIVVTDGNEERLYSKRLSYTDAPQGKWKFYLQNNTLYLPTEH